jgi:RNA polymerase sigma-70 factor (ECF subfamily)
MNSEAASLFSGILVEGSATSRAEVRDSRIPPERAQIQFGVARALGDCSSVGEDVRLVANHSDEVSFEELRKGDKEALAVLFRRYARIVRAVAYRILRDESEADDLLQEVFLFIFRKAALFDASRGSARSWIVQITYHRAIDRRRYLISRRFYSSLAFGDSAIGSTELGTEIAFYEQSMEGTFGTAMLKKIDESLSEDQRRTIQLHFFQGYTLEEIAARTGQSLGNVRNHYYRGLDRMRKIVFAAKLQAK